MAKLLNQQAKQLIGSDDKVHFDSMTVPEQVKHIAKMREIEDIENELKKYKTLNEINASLSATVDLP
jgi:hypothetical protein